MGLEGRAPNPYPVRPFLSSAPGKAPASFLSIPPMPEIPKARSARRKPGGGRGPYKRRRSSLIESGRNAAEHCVQVRAEAAHHGDNGN
jgi:hypothetical protein